MTIFTRTLRDRDDPSVEIPVRVFAPALAAIDWFCRVEIGWPGKPWGRDVTGIDAIHALELALRMVGTELYCSDLHAEGRLIWLEPGDGYGFPVPNTIRDVLIGGDKLHL